MSTSLKYEITVSRASKGIYAVHLHSTRQEFVPAESIGEAVALVERAIAAHDSSHYVQGLRFNGDMMDDEFSGSWMRREIQRQIEIAA